MPKDSDDTGDENELTEYRKWHSVVHARARIHAAELAENLPGVVQWREAHLPNGELIDPASAERWIRSVGLGSSGQEVEVSFTWLSRDRGIRSKTVRARVGRAIWQELANVAGMLGDRFGWSRKSAAAWVVSGCEPQTSGISGRYRPEPSDSDSLWGAVELSIPVEVSPPLAARFYAIQRNYALSRMGALGEQIAKSARPPTERTCLIVAFAVERNDGRSFADVLDEWNAHCDSAGLPPDWQTDSQRGFANTVRQGYQAIVGRPLIWKRRAGSARSESS